MKHPTGIITGIKGFSTEQLTIAFIFSCLIGIVVNVFRNLVIEFVILGYFGYIEGTETGSKHSVINWDFFHTANKDYIEQVESSYYVFYSGSINLSISLSIALSLLCRSNYIPCFIWWSVFIVTFLIFTYGIYPLRRQMIRATWNLQKLSGCVESGHDSMDFFNKEAVQTLCDGKTRGKKIICKCSSSYLTRIILSIAVILGLAFIIQLF